MKFDMSTIPAARTAKSDNSKFAMVKLPASMPVSKQRQICLAILAEQENPISVSDAAKIAEEKGLKSVDTYVNSVRYHFNALVKEGTVVKS